jgi:hypothetical protein
MNGFPAELIYALVFGAILLYQYLMKRFGPQQQPDEAPQEAPLPQEKPIPREESFSESWGRAAAIPSVSPAAATSDIRFGRSEAPRATVALAGRRSRRFSRRALMGTRREVQNAIVIATILGPCRAYEPHDIR